MPECLHILTAKYRGEGTKKELVYFCKYCGKELKEIKEERKDK